MTRPLLALMLAVTVAGCDTSSGSSETTPTVIELSATARDVVAQSNAFGVGLFAETAAGQPGNLMLSPLGASAALTMLLNGADGETAAQIRDVLGYAGGDLDAVNQAYRSLTGQLLAADPAVQFTLANAVFYDRQFSQGSPFKPAFLAAMDGPFGARVEGLDFLAPASVDVVNRWAEESTNGRVPKVLAEINRDDVLYLLNALYYKGAWSTPFDPDRTAPADFRLADGRTVRVPTMAASVPAITVRGEGYEALELPYGRRNFSMVVLMPDGDAPLAGFADDLRDGLWTDAAARLDAQTAWPETIVRLPRFSFSYEKALNDQLRALGMVEAFTDDADLTRMNDDPRLLVTLVKQNTFVEVNEEGTEAAAVTTVGVGVTSAPPSFAVDRPFVFAIRERTTGALLFIGQVADPSS